MATIGLTEERFFASLARAAVARSERFTAEEILALSIAFDKANLVHLPLVDACTKLLKGQVAQVSAKELAKGLRGLTMCCVRDVELGRAVGDYFQTGPK
ncbi:unnamed protein product, partial [Polarella glacialis]